MHALALERVQVDRQRGNQGLSFTGLHFGDPSEVQRHATHQLLVVVALAEHAGRTLSHDREGLEQQVVERLAVGETDPELLGLGPKLLVAQRRHLVGEGVDGCDEFGQLANPLAFSCL